MDDGSGAPSTSGAVTEALETADQYAIQGELFSKAIRTGEPLEFALENAVDNMRIIDAVFRSAKSGAWETV